MLVAMATYTSELFMQEIIQSLGETISREIIEDLLASPFFSLSVDEMTDVSVTKQPIAYGHCIANGDAKTSQNLGAV